MIACASVSRSPDGVAWESAGEGTYEIADVPDAPTHASLVEDAGGRVALVPGEKTNIKLTTPEDLIFAEAILISREGARNGERWSARHGMCF